MKFKKKYLVPCVLLAVSGGFAAHAQQAQQQQSPGDTEQVKIDRRNADMLKMATDMLAHDPKVLTRPIILTIDVGSRSDTFTFDKKEMVFTRQPNASKNTLRISAEVPILRQCGIGFSYNGAEPTVVSELSIHSGNQLVDTLTIPDRGAVEVSMDMDANKNFVFPDGSQSTLESIEQETIKAGLKSAVDNFNDMFQNLGYKISLDNAQIDDSRNPYHQTQYTQDDPNDFCAKIRQDIKKSKLEQKSDSTINPFGSISASGITDSSWSITYNAYTITISVIPTQI